MYTGVTKVCQDQVDNFFAIGQDLGVKGLEEINTQHFQLSIDMEDDMKENFRINDFNTKTTESIIHLDARICVPQLDNESIELQLTQPDIELHY